jgi:hypothetical protein
MMSIRLSTRFWGILLFVISAAVGAPTASAARYGWDFNNGNLAPTSGSANGSMTYRGDTAALTFFESTGGVYPHINGQAANYLRHDRWPTPSDNDPTLGYALTFADSGPNGGGLYINQYSFIIDLYIPGNIDFVPIFQTDSEMTAGDDADFYVVADGSLGNYSLGFSVADIIRPDTWNRIGFVADLAMDDVRYYLNGALVHTTPTAGLFDGQFALYSNQDAGPDLVLFNEATFGGNQTDAALYNSIAFVDRVVTGAEMAALGGPTASGILTIPEPTTGATLVWSGLLVLSRGRRRVSLTWE